MNYGEEIRTRREKASLTQTDLANQLGCTQPYLNNIESGRKGVSKTQFLRILNLLGYKLVEKIVKIN